MPTVEHIHEALIVQAMLDGLKPESEISLDQWADQFRYLPQKASPEPGKYRTSRTPYLREIMEVLSVNSWITDICFMKPTQIGATEAGNNFIFYTIDVAPAPILMVLPTDALARAHSKQKLATSIQETPKIKGKIRAEKRKETGNTILEKEFPGGILYLSGSNSPANYRNKTVRYLFLDDIDGFEADVGGEGDPADLARKRTDSYGYRKKIFEVSTPTVKDASRIEISFNESDQRYYHVPCPHCQEMQPLEWGGKDEEFGIKFERNPKGQVIYAWYQCKFCKDVIEEKDKTWMLNNGEWVPTHPEREKRGYHISALYSPLGWVSWLQICKEFLSAIGKINKMKVWMNTRLALPYETPSQKLEWTELKNRAEPYEVLTVPEGALMLSAGVDTQDNRLVCSIYGWGRGEESWLIYHDELYGDPAQDAVWESLDVLLNRAYLKASGEALHILTMAVDSAGHRTQAVYNYCRRRQPRVIAIHGATKPNKPVITSAPSLQDVDWKGQKIKGGVQLWQVGTDTAKSTIYGRLQIQEPGHGFVHFPIGMQNSFYSQLTAEKCVTLLDRKSGHPRLQWVKIRERNDALDCFDSETEVLTECGWKLFKGLDGEESLATVNLETDFIEYQSPQMLIEKNYSGEMINFKARRLDILVTPKHRMVAQKVLSVNGKKTWDSPPQIILAKDMKAHMAIKMRGKWKGTEDDEFIIPATQNEQLEKAKNIIRTKYGTWKVYANIRGNRKSKTFKTKDEAKFYRDQLVNLRNENFDNMKVVDFGDWAEFVGWYVSEGSTFMGRSTTQGNIRHRVHISQREGEKSEKIKALLKRLPWKWHYNKLNFTITSKQLYQAVQECGKGAENKKVPRYIKNASPEVIKRFLESAVWGDGWTCKHGHRTYATVSKRLADDMQELFLKINRWAVIKKRKPESFAKSHIGGRRIYAQKVQYHVSEIRTKRAYLYGKNRKPCIDSVQYNGKVYCATVPNGTLICRRNGKSFIAGNCAVYSYAAAIRAGLLFADWDQATKPEPQKRKVRSKGVR